jgi:hypothetical protein
VNRTDSGQEDFEDKSGKGENVLPFNGRHHGNCSATQTVWTLKVKGIKDRSRSGS